MAFCVNCGTINREGSRFCSGCGAKISDLRIDDAGQKIYHKREVYKCPNCDMVLGSFSNKCPACGCELKGIKVSDIVYEFALRLSQTENNIQKCNLIRSFPIPNTKEDIFDFMILALSNMDTGRLNINDQSSEVADAWVAKFEQSYQKAKMVYYEDSFFIKIQEIYDQGCKKIARKNGGIAAQKVGKIIARNAGFLAGIMILLVDVVAYLTGEGNGLFQLVGCILVVLSASALKRNNVLFIDLVIGVVSGMIMVIFCCLMRRNGILRLGTMLTFIIVAINFFKYLNGGKPI